VCNLNEGNGGDGGSKGDGYNDNVYDGGNGGFGLISIKSKYITVTPGQSITITVGNGLNTALYFGNLSKYLFIF
jgi:hypothetical protein